MIWSIVGHYNECELVYGHCSECQHEFIILGLFAVGLCAKSSLLGRLIYHKQKLGSKWAHHTIHWPPIYRVGHKKLSPYMSVFCGPLYRFLKQQDTNL